jgi:hypothetical protein
MRLESPIFRFILVAAAAIPLIATPAMSSGASARSDATVTRRVNTGVLSASVSWEVDEDTHEDVLRGWVEYRALGGPDCDCTSIRFVQVARIRQTDGRDLEWQLGEAPRNLMRTVADRGAGVQSGYFLDHDAFKCTAGRPCSPYYRDSWANPRESRDGFVIGNHVAAASLVDYPFGWSMFETISLEACARCVDSGRFLGCVTWGGAMPPIGARRVLPIQMSEAPSPTFQAALARFEAFYTPTSGSSR